MPRGLELLLEAERRGILPDEKKGLLAEARQRGLVPGGSAPATPEAPQAAPEAPQSMGLGEMASSAVSNLPGSAWQFAKDVTAPIHSPVETAKGLGGLAAGAYERMGRGAKGLALGPEEAQKLQPGENEGSVDALMSFLAERFGGLENIKGTVAEDPAGFLADIAGLAMGGGGLAVKAAGTAGKLGAAAKKVGQAGRAIDPARLASAGAKRAGQASIHGCFGSSRFDDRSKRSADQGGFQVRSAGWSEGQGVPGVTSRATCRWIRLWRKPAPPWGTCTRPRWKPIELGWDRRSRNPPRNP